VFALLAAGISLSHQSTPISFSFDNPDTRHWIGEDWLNNPLQDWQLSNGRVECLNAAQNRSAALLTADLSDDKPFELSLRVGLINFSRRNPPSLIGVELGRKETYGHYKVAAVFGRGLRIGISADGRLKVGDQEGSENLRSGIENIRLTIRRTSDKLEVTAEAVGGNATDTITLMGDEVPDLGGPVAMLSHLVSMKNTDFVADSWFDDFSLSGEAVNHHPNRAFGPLLFSQFTLSRGNLKMTAQFPPLGEKDGQFAELQAKHFGSWQTVNQAKIDPVSRTATFRANNWRTALDVPYRIVWNAYDSEGELVRSEKHGVVRKEPKDRDMVVGALTCFYQTGYPSAEISEGIQKLNPDIYLFSGDQMYEGNGGFGVKFNGPFEIQVLDYLNKWNLFGWAFGDLFVDTPSITIPDDHDVFHGNVWGNAGKHISGTGKGADFQDGGGYKMGPDFVNMVQLTQTSHLPDPVDPTPLDNGIGVYYTDLEYGGISMAVLEDRKWKSAPREILKDADIWNGFIRNPDFDMRESDHPQAVLLGRRQEDFLAEWATDWQEGIRHKLVLSQTVFSCQQTLPRGEKNDQNVPSLPIPALGEYPPDDMPVRDFDSNSWPQTPRNRAVDILRQATALHVAGDQHLGSLIQYGVGEEINGLLAFCTPSISNVWPRRWMPITEGENRKPGSPRYTGDFVDGFGNPLRVHAIANPRKTGMKPWPVYDKATGYSVIRFGKDSGDIRIECWPRWISDPTDPAAKQYDGWPFSYKTIDLLMEMSAGVVGPLSVPAGGAVVESIDERTGEMEYKTWLPEGEHLIPCLSVTRHTVKMGDRIVVQSEIPRPRPERS
jgi:hypothetical protein